ncbi:MAG TPA: HIT family protein [Candidatus Dormibacteraeota bacterium]|nr:HIT family protein [Candidatus Dormibacteraeota bacterium]
MGVSPGGQASSSLLGTSGCPFCAIISGVAPAHEVWRDGEKMAFLDRRPLLLGHCLVVPTAHISSILDLVPGQLLPLMQLVQRLAVALMEALDAHGTFIAVNDRVSQSVPHVHIHVVPRRRGDGLRGFFWPRTKYESEEQAAEYRDRIRAALGDYADRDRRL